MQARVCEASNKQRARKLNVMNGSVVLVNVRVHKTQRDWLLHCEAPHAIGSYLQPHAKILPFREIRYEAKPLAAHGPTALLV